MTALPRPSTPARPVIVAFAVLVVVGTGALVVPVVSTGRGVPDLTDARLTAVSAVAVTGRAVVDTPSYRPPLGHAIILVLAQAGGLGTMTSASLLGLLTSRRLGPASATGAIAETRSVGPGDVRRVLADVVRTSLVIEAVVAPAPALRLAVACGAPPLKAAWRGIFHAVSAVSRAGLALRSDLLVRVRGDPWILVALAAAVLLGGSGFPTLLAIARDVVAARHRRPRRWSLNTALVIGSTVVVLPLVLVALVALVALEWGGIELTTAAVLLIVIVIVIVIVAEARGEEVVTAFRRRNPPCPSSPSRCRSHCPRRAWWRWRHSR